MGACVGKPSAEVGHGSSPHGAADATVKMFSSKGAHQPQQLRDKQLLPALPDTPLKGYTIPAGPGRVSREDITLPAAAPSPISKVLPTPRSAAPGTLRVSILHHGHARSHVAHGMHPSGLLLSGASCMPASD